MGYFNRNANISDSCGGLGTIFNFSAIMNMKRILILIIGLIGVSYGQSSPTSAKTRFVNGIYVGTKLDSYFAAADSNAIYWRADSALMAKYKGTARALAFSGELGGYV